MAPFDRSYATYYWSAIVNAWWLIKNVQNFAMMLYSTTIEFKQKEIMFLKSNLS